MTLPTIAALAAGLALLAAPAAALTPLDYEDALRAALVQQGCAFDAGGEGAEMRFSRQLGITLGVPAAEVSDREGPHHAALKGAVERMAERGILAVDGARVALTDCRP